MKKVIVMFSLTLFARMVVAQPVDLRELAGEAWYGLYLNGQKSGYAVNTLEVDDAGRVTLTEDARFMISMGGVKQDMRIYSERIYAPDGQLQELRSVMDDPASRSVWDGVVTDDQLVVQSTIAGKTQTQTYPAPKESLQDYLKQLALIRGTPEVGDTTTFTLFEPMHQREVSGTSTIVGQEERVLHGVKTKVYTLKTVIDLMGLETTSVVTEDAFLRSRTRCSSLIWPMTTSPSTCARGAAHSASCWSIRRSPRTSITTTTSSCRTRPCWTSGWPIRAAGRP